MYSKDCVKKMKHNDRVLYITNTIAEYRVCFFEELSSMIDMTFLITHPEMANKIYGSDGNTNSIKVINLNGSLHSRISGIKRIITDGDFTKVILPPADSVTEIVEGYVSLHYAKRKKAEIFTWTEKWEPDKRYQPLKKRIKNMVQRVAYGHYARNATRCIAFGKKSEEYIISVGSEISKTRIAHMTSIPPTDMNLYSLREKYGIDSTKKIIFCLARMIPRKGIEVLIDAMSVINKRHSDCLLLLGGDGPLKKQLEERARSLEVNNVIFAGRIPPEERSTLYAQSDVFVLPSRIVDGIIEGWGLPVNESLYCATPVVATTAVGSAYDMLDGTSGIMVEEGNAEKLAEGIEKVLYGSDKVLQQQSIEKINDEFSIRVMTNGFVSALYK